MVEESLAGPSLVWAREGVPEKVAFEGGWAEAARCYLHGVEVAVGSESRGEAAGRRSCLC